MLVLFNIISFLFFIAIFLTYPKQICGGPKSSKSSDSLKAPLLNSKRISGAKSSKSSVSPKVPLLPKSSLKSSAPKSTPNQSKSTKNSNSAINCEKINHSLESFKHSIIKSPNEYRFKPRNHYKLRILSGPIGKPQKQFHFVTDEKGKIKWNFTTEVRENKFTPKGFKNCKSKLPVTILVETTKESRLLAKYKNYAQMKKKMLARKGKLCKENIIKFNELELVKTKTVKWRSTLEEYRFFVSDHENDVEDERIKKPKKKLDEMTKLKNILNDQPAESTNDEDEDEEDDTDDEEDWNVAEEEED